MTRHVTEIKILGCDLPQDAINAHARGLHPGTTDAEGMKALVVDVIVLSTEPTVALTIIQSVMNTDNEVLIVIGVVEVPRLQILIKDCLLQARRS